MTEGWHDVLQNYRWLGGRWVLTCGKVVPCEERGMTLLMFDSTDLGVRNAA